MAEGVLLGTGSLISLPSSEAIMLLLQLIFFFWEGIFLDSRSFLLQEDAAGEKAPFLCHVLDV